MLAVKQTNNSAKRASEAADEAFSETTEKVQKNEDEAKSLDELISKYKELKESENLDVDGRKEIKKSKMTLLIQLVYKHQMHDEKDVFDVRS